MATRFLPQFFLLLTAAGIYAGGFWAGTGILLVLLTHPLLDYFYGDEPENDDIPKWISNFTLITVPVILLAMWLQMFLSSSHWILTSVSTGMMLGAFGISLSHELVHRTKKWQVGLGVFLLSLVNYQHFRIEHVYGHHKWVGTPSDPATARYREDIFRFWTRSIVGQYLNAWRWESQQVGFWKLHRMWIYTGIQTSLWLSVAALFGPAGVAKWAICSLTAILLLETVNYIEHYGLSRNNENDRWEPVGPQHSWDCKYQLTNSVLFNLGRHAHHHHRPNVSYEKLKCLPQAHKMPLGYSAMILIALLPPVWFRMIHPHLESPSSTFAKAESS